MNTSRGKSIRFKRGMAMAMTMVVLLVIMCGVLLGMVASNLGHPQTQSGLIYTAGNATKMASTRMSQTSAFNLAESGVEYTLEWMHEQASPPAETVAFAPSLWGATASGNPSRAVASYGGGQFSVEVYPDTSNPNQSQKKYLIESIGTYGTNSVVLQAYVQQASFGKYAYFTNTDPSNGWWVGGLTTMDGPVHSNEADGVPTNVLWFDNAGTSKQWLIYNGPDAFTASAPTINWADDQWTNAQAPASSSDWTAVAVGGASTIHTGVAQVPLPTVNTVQQSAALGASTAPTSIGVLVPNSNGNTSAGMYIHGAVNNITLSAPGGTSQQIVINQTDASSNSLDTTILMNPSTNQTTVTVVSGPATNRVTSTHTYSGLTNGVLYSDSTIGSSGSNPGKGLSGVIADNYYNGTTLSHRSGLTIATDANANIYLNGSVTYNTPRPKDSNGNFVAESNSLAANFMSKAGTFGIVTNNTVVLQHDSTGANQVNYEMDGVALSRGTFNSEAWSVSGFNNFYDMGGYIAGQAGIMGEMDLSGNLIAGYREHYNYDGRLANTPPPFFPTTGTQYDIVSWAQVTSTLQ